MPNLLMVYTVALWIHHKSTHVLVLCRSPLLMVVACTVAVSLVFVSPFEVAAISAVPVPVVVFEFRIPFLSEVSVDHFVSFEPEEVGDLHRCCVLENERKRIVSHVSSMSVTASSYSTLLTR